MKYIAFNNDYVLKPDEGRTLVLAALVGRNKQEGISDSFTNVIHPIYAMILSFIDGREYNECIEEAADELGVSRELVEGFVSKLVDNSEQIHIKSNEYISTFPPFTIVSMQEKAQCRRYAPELFEYDAIDLRMKRHKTPSTITLMLNNICATNCIYCYQDKSRKVKCQIPLERILELIHEAHELHVNTFDVIGGEFFLYEHWKEVLAELRKYGFNPYISTKVPIEEEDIKFLRDIGLQDIQISLDTAIEDNIIASLGVKQGYMAKMAKTIKMMDKHGIPMMFHTVLTRFNQTSKDMGSVYQLIGGLKNLVDWHVVKGEESLYAKAKYEDIVIENDALNNVVDYLASLKDAGVPVRFPNKEKPEIEKVLIKHNDDHIKSFFDRAFCSGLFSSLYILPDGNVTICEQLYWNKDFIVGNILNESINDVWNSSKALALYNIKQEDIPSDSLCHTCQHFEACRTVRQVCYREIIRKYGAKKWYYPDPSCPFVE